MYKLGSITFNLFLFLVFIYYYIRRSVEAHFHKNWPLRLTIPAVFINQIPTNNSVLGLSCSVIHGSHYVITIFDFLEFWSIFANKTIIIQQNTMIYISN